MCLPYLIIDVDDSKPRRKPKCKPAPTAPCLPSSRPVEVVEVEEINTAPMPVTMICRSPRPRHSRAACEEVYVNVRTVEPKVETRMERKCGCEGRWRCECGTPMGQGVWEEWMRGVEREREREAKEKERETKEKEREAKEKEREAKEKEREARERQKEKEAKDKEASDKAGREKQPPPAPAPAQPPPKPQFQPQPQIIINNPIPLYRPNLRRNSSSSSSSTYKRGFVDVKRKVGILWGRTRELQHKEQQRERERQARERDLQDRRDAEIARERERARLAAEEWNRERAFAAAREREREAAARARERERVCEIVREAEELERVREVVRETEERERARERLVRDAERMARERGSICDLGLSERVRECEARERGRDLDIRERARILALEAERENGRWREDVGEWRRRRWVGRECR